MKYNLSKSTRATKKWMVRFISPKTGNINTVHFGQAGAEDFTIHKDPIRKELYENRHINDKILDLSKPGAWSWWLLWNEPTMEESIRFMENAFQIEIRRLPSH